MLSSLTTNQIAVVAKSKRELYFLLKNEARVYLPPIGEVNIKFIRALMLGHKKVSSSIYA